MALPNPWQRLLLALALYLAPGLSYSEPPETLIVVGAYYFPPIADFGPDQEPVGLLADLVQELEADTPGVHFRIFHTSPKRRYMDFDAGLYDVIFFENPDWGWSGRDISIGPPLLMDQDVYVALRKPGRDLSFFDDIEHRKIVALAGYHYGFIARITDSTTVSPNFAIELSDNNNRNLQLIKADRPSVAEIAVINRSFLQAHLARHPEDRELLLTSDQPDQNYLLRIIARKGGATSADELTHMLKPVIADGRYRQMVEKWGLQLPRNGLAGLEQP